MTNRVLIGIALLASILLLCRYLDSPPVESTTSEEKGAPVTVGGTGIKTLQKNSGLRELKVRTDATSTYLDLDIVPKGWCNLGDLEAIQKDLEDNNTSRLLLTVEAIRNDGSFTPVVQSTSLPELNSGGQKTFALPVMEKPTQLALYLCRDAAGTSRCADKPVVDMNDIYRGGTLGVPKKRDDVTYYFQYLYFKSPGIVTAFEDAIPSDLKFERAAAFVGFTGGAGKNPVRTREIMMEVKNKTKAARSLALESTGARIKLTLARYDKSTCQH